MQKQFCKEILKKSLTNTTWKKKHYSNKNSEEEVCTENIWREIIARKSLQRNPYRKSQNGNSCPTKFWRETSSNKYLKRQFFTKKFLKRNHYQKICDKVLCQSISKETFPAKGLERGISTKKNQNIFGKISLTISLPRTLWRETYTKQISAETSTEKYWNKNIFHKLPEGKSLQKKKSKEPPTTKNLRKKSTKQIIQEKSLKQCPKKPLPTKLRTKMFGQKFLSNQVAQTKLWRENKYRKNEEKSLPKKFCRETCTKNLRKIIFVQTNFEEKLLPTNTWRETLYQEVFEGKSLPKQYVTKFSAKKSLKRHSLPKVWKKGGISTKKNQNIFGKISLTISLPRTLWREIYAKQFSAVIPTEKVLDESFLPQTPWREIFTKQFSKETPTNKYFGKKSTKQIFTEKSLPKPCPKISLLQTICR